MVTRMLQTRVLGLADHSLGNDPCQHNPLPWPQDGCLSFHFPGCFSNFWPRILDISAKQVFPTSLSLSLSLFLFLMALPFLYSWWRSFDKGQMPSMPLQDIIPCEGEEEEDEEVCWFLGEILLFYCLAVVVLKLGYLGVKRFFLKQPCGTLTCNWKVHSKGGQDCSCQCHCKITICGLFRKIFGGKGNQEDGDPAVSPPIKKRLKKRLSWLSQQTFCDSDSSGTSSPDSQLSSWKWSQTGDSISLASRKRKQRTAKTPRDPEISWMRQQPCMRCKAKRTHEWLVHHFYSKDSPLPSKKN